MLRKCLPKRCCSKIGQKLENGVGVAKRDALFLKVSGNGENNLLLFILFCGLNNLGPTRSRNVRSHRCLYRMLRIFGVFTLLGNQLQRHHSHFCVSEETVVDRPSVHNHSFLRFSSFLATTSLLRIRYISPGSVLTVYTAACCIRRSHTPHKEHSSVSQAVVAYDEQQLSTRQPQLCVWE